MTTKSCDSHIDDFDKSNMVNEMYTSKIDVHVLLVPDNVNVRPIEHEALSAIGWGGSPNKNIT